MQWQCDSCSRWNMPDVRWCAGCNAIIPPAKAIALQAGDFAGSALTEIRQQLDKHGDELRDFVRGVRELVGK